MADQYCLNCGARLHGPFCHACGQPVKGMIRHFKSIVADVLDTIFEYDGRIWRTPVPLYFVPGKVTRDFIAGRRTRYVTPFRLAFVSSVVAFLAGLALAWLPVYILFMQRQVYRQNWPLTIAKYLVIGGISAVLVIAGVVVAVLVTLVRG